eukprot:CAMPEP_0198140042 /NCGR_PEP_ID=MMETSP1443-20131203/3266_1 /TAXON_ID=186043 /ORGANISM="Entomoneis sp., Strain CCMP2396" /LENGTH=112 /DNA_ID=CAMNT_0043802351 /DNA_START=235 /DNA_END=573 /DNA_ORIENTATION=+
MVSSGFTFSDGEQVLVSIQKPLGILLEQENTSSDNETSNTGDDQTQTQQVTPSPVVVADVVTGGAAAGAGLQLGDVLVAVQNADMVGKPLEEVMEFISGAPRVVNLRFLRLE